MAEQHEILLTIPADPEFVRVARVTASGLASRLGFSIDDVDDLRLALDELCHAVLDRAPDGAALNLRYLVSDDALEMEGTSQGALTDAVARPEAVNELSRQILTALVDEHRVWSDEGGRHFSLTKKRVGAL